MITAALLPVIIGLPLFVLVGWQQMQIHRYRQELNKSGTYDRLTGCLNGPVFASMIERRTARRPGPGPRTGAFLIIHPEHLRSINTRFGLEWGDEALRLIVSTIQSSVREEDLVGRIGASMFGVFLSGATEAEAEEIGERIRTRVAQVYFAPKGTEAVLTIKVGGVMFENEVEFGDMFRSAEQRLSEAQDGAGFELTHLNS
ncbi:GGDEF domain-containing protein [Mesorhizobium sp. dw_380]|uniref:GGDEF domain-containing protein n=1 Tax=Mesorhizobium sp. dw_380 TaxID=2812001 RepID=UPI002032E7F5|nr:GGDEF domain-containing protein [Mesorhizobium sp. dw_380]